MTEVELTPAQSLAVAMIKRYDFLVEEETMRNPKDNSWVEQQIAYQKGESETPPEFVTSYSMVKRDASIYREFPIHRMTLKSLINLRILRPVKVYDNTRRREVKVSNIEELKTQKAIGTLPKVRKITYELDKRVKFIVPVVTARIPEWKTPI